MSEGDSAVETECPGCDDLLREVDRLRARLAAVEAERDAIQALLDDVTADASKLADRLAEVRALCERNFNMEDYYEIDANDVAAILEGRAVLADPQPAPAEHADSCCLSGHPLAPPNRITEECIDRCSCGVADPAPAPADHIALFDGPPMRALPAPEPAPRTETTMPSPNDTAAFRREWAGCSGIAVPAEPDDSCFSCVVLTLCDEIDALRAKVENALDVWRTHNNGIGGFKDACVCVACIMAAALLSAAISGPVDDA